MLWRLKRLWFAALYALVWFDAQVELEFAVNTVHAFVIPAFTLYVSKV